MLGDNQEEKTPVKINKKYFLSEMFTLNMNCAGCMDIWNA
jgi:hypothetical protein